MDTNIYSVSCWAKILTNPTTSKKTIIYHLTNLELKLFLVFSYIFFFFRGENNIPIDSSTLDSS